MTFEIFFGLFGMFAAMAGVGWLLWRTNWRIPGPLKHKDVAIRVGNWFGAIVLLALTVLYFDDPSARARVAEAPLVWSAGYFAGWLLFAAPAWCLGWIAGSLFKRRST